jgi:ubiquilin
MNKNCPQDFVISDDVLDEVNTVLPEQLYAPQLSQLQEMGFLDAQENVHALIAVGGNVTTAVEWLLGNLS